MEPASATGLSGCGDEGLLDLVVADREVDDLVAVSRMEYCWMLKS
jgi:hypothetical protein